MTEEMVKNYRELKSQVDHLRYGLNDGKANGPLQPWKEAIDEYHNKMATIAKQLTHDERKELGLLFRQRLGIGQRIQR